MAAGREAEFAAAIVGRPNVGKSTLFNRLVGRRIALVHGTAGTTRDRKEGEARLYDLRFRVIDTAGLEEADPNAIETRMVGQTLKAVADADLVLFMVDARAGLTPLDRHFAQRLRKFGKPLVLLANKCEGKAGAAGLAEAFALGFGEPVALSAEHGEGMADLYHALTAFVPPEAKPENADDAEAPPPRPLTLAIVGQPNAGKSTLMNRLLGEERVIVGPEPGLTRDSIAIDWRWRERAIRLVDTAGLRRKAKVADPLEKLSAIDAMRAIQFADIVVLLIDAVTVQDFGQGIEKQDLQIAAHVEAEGRGLVVALNKWDLVADPSKQRKLVKDSHDRSLAQLRDVPMVTISARDGTNLDRLMQEVMAIDEKWNTRVSTSRLNRWLTAALEENPPPMVRGRRIKIRYMTQARTRPPTFAIFASQAEKLPDAY
ncbi:MAG: ribosome biogenesis GTPase Der, partial [Alphaproteobacteria bacterium]